METAIAVEKDSYVLCSFCGAEVEVTWDDGVPVLSDPCPHLEGAEWEGEPGLAEFLARR